MPPPHASSAPGLPGVGPYDGVILERPDHANAPRRTSDVARLAVGTVLAVAGVAGLVVNVFLVRHAHLYRQRSHEGLGFVWALAEFLVAALLTLAAAACFAWSAARDTTGSRVVSGWMAALLVVAVVVVGGFGLWVESHGSRCIGGC